MAKVLNCNKLVSEFELHSRYYVHFRTNALVKGMKTLIVTRYKLRNTTVVLLQGWLWYYITHDRLYPIKQRNLLITFYNQ